MNGAPKGLVKIPSLFFNHRTSLLIMMGAAFFGSFGGLGVKEITGHPMAIVGIRSGIAGLLMLLFLGTPRLTFSKVQIGGAVSYAACLILSVISLKLTTAANSVLLINTAPVYVAILGGWLLRERTSLKDWVMLLVVMTGLALFFADKISFGGMIGNICAAAGGFALALVGIFMRMQKNSHNLETFLIGNLLIFIISLPWINVLPNKSDMWILIGLGLFQIGFADILYAISIRNVSALESKLIYNVKPVLNVFWVFLFLGEIPGKWALMGG